MICKICGKEFHGFGAQVKLLVEDGKKADYTFADYCCPECAERLRQEKLAKAHN